MNAFRGCRIFVIVSANVLIWRVWAALRRSFGGPQQPTTSRGDSNLLTALRESIISGVVGGPEKVGVPDPGFHRPLI